MSTSADQGGSIQVQDSGAAGGNGGAVVFGANQGFFAAIKGLLTNGSTNTAGDLAFSTRAAVGDASLTERMRFLSTGEVGIGTASPSSLLHVYKSTSPDVYVKIEHSSTNPAYLLFTTSQGVAAIGMGNFSGTGFTNNLQLVCDGGIHLNPSGTGSVGIGTNNPATPLHVVGQVSNEVARFQGRTDSSNNRNFISVYTTNPAFWWELSNQDASGTGSTNGLAFLERSNAAAVNRVYFAAGGNVGIGTASPANKFTVLTSGALNTVGDAIDVGATFTGADHAFGASGNPAILNIHSNSTLGADVGATIGLGGRYTGTSFAQFAIIKGAKENATDGNFASYLAFGTRAGGNINERMRISSAGEVLIAGTTDNGAYNLQCNGTGVWGAGPYVDGSDVKLKTNIQPIHNSLHLVNRLNPVTFNYIPEYNKNRNTHTGFIAQELKEILKDQIYVDGIVQQGPEFLSVAYQSLIPLLVKAVQELSEQNKQLAEEINKLKG
jgi:hypothetical protein